MSPDITQVTPFSPDVEPADSTTPIRRLVTGIDSEGLSTIVDDAICPRLVAHRVPTSVSTELWRTGRTPADNFGPFADPVAGDKTPRIAPPLNGSVFRIVEFPSDTDWRVDDDGNEVFPLDVHATASVDYAIVLRGEVWAILDATESHMRAGDVLVQRGTRHAWSNRSGQPCLVAFTLIGGTVIP